MPESRYVPASKLRPMLIYCGVALVVLLVAYAVMGSAGVDGREFLVPAWIVAFPLGGLWTWRRTR